jgi:adenine-specific DNA methylase
MSQPKKLIEVAMPVKEVSAESVRDKSIRHGHISTLHLWWARRPLPVCRAVVFASLVPDPLDPDCPQAFKDAVKLLLGKQENNIDPYKPYKDIPYTSAIDKMEDNLRNRLLMFIGKFSDEYAHNERMGKSTAANKQLSDYSLIKWDNKNNEGIINKARKLIWVSQNAKNGSSAEALLSDFDKHYKAIKDAEQALYNTPNRHIATDDVNKREVALQKAVDSFLDRMPKVFDPFAGGGAIPLEAARLGCRSYGNDINPVAHIIQKGSLEFPQKCGKPITYSKEEFIKLYGETLWNEEPQENKIVRNGEPVAVRIENRLAFDVEFYAKKLLAFAEKVVGHLYPEDKNGKKPLAYYWVYYAKCTNPSCRRDVPMFKDYYIVNKPEKKVYIKLNNNGKEISFSLKNGKHDQKPTFEKKKLLCPFCQNITNDKELKEQFTKRSPYRKIVAVIDSGKDGKVYRLPHSKEINLEERITRVNDIQEEITKNDTRSLWLTIWGVSRWGDMFTNRQLNFLNTLSSQIAEVKDDLLDEDYSRAIKTYLTIWLDKIAAVNTAFGRWNVSGENIEHPFSRQGIAMMFDFPEVHPFSSETGSSLNMLDWIIRYIESESGYPFTTFCNHASSGEKISLMRSFLQQS